VILNRRLKHNWVVAMKIFIVEKGNAAKILKWFRSHKDEEYADILEDVVNESRDRLSLR
jgi:hypothetical protein